MFLTKGKNQDSILDGYTLEGLIVFGKDLLLEDSVIASEADSKKVCSSLRYLLVLILSVIVFSYFCMCVCGGGGY